MYLTTEDIYASYHHHNSLICIACLICTRLILTEPILRLYASPHVSSTLGTLSHVFEYT